MKYEYNLCPPTFRVGDIDIISVSRPKNYKHSFRRGREKHGFIYVVSGCLVDSFRNFDIPQLVAQRGELVFIPKGSVYTGMYAEDDTKIKMIQFDLISGELPEYFSKPTKIILPRAHELVDAFFRPIEKDGGYHPFYYLSCLYELLWRIDESISHLPKKYRKLSPALSELSERWQRNERVSFYAELCDMSETNFRRLFKEYTGLSPLDYRNEIRLNHARGKLLSGEYNVSETAYETGFTNLSFFIRLYKKRFGHTPKEEQTT